MSNFLRWLARVPFGPSALRHDADDANAVFDRVDGHGLPDGACRASGSMSFDERPMVDFSDTLPSWSTGGASRDRGQRIAAR